MLSFNPRLVAPICLDRKQKYAYTNLSPLLPSLSPFFSSLPVSLAQTCPGHLLCAAPCVELRVPGQWHRQEGGAGSVSAARQHRSWTLAQLRKLSYLSVFPSQLKIHGNCSRQESQSLLEGDQLQKVMGNVGEGLGVRDVCVCGGASFCAWKDLGLLHAAFLSFFLFCCKFLGTFITKLVQLLMISNYCLPCAWH